MGVSVNEILYDYSWQNLIMYSAATPQYDDVKDEWDDTKDANNPDTFIDDEIEYVPL